MRKANYYHVFPSDEEAAHQFQDGGCTCNPIMEKQPNGDWVVRHRSYLARELFENGKKPIIN